MIKNVNNLFKFQLLMNLSNVLCDITVLDIFSLRSELDIFMKLCVEMRLNIIKEANNLFKLQFSCIQVNIYTKLVLCNLHIDELIMKIYIRHHLEPFYECELNYVYCNFI
jgi:hypothetical protein